MKEDQKRFMLLSNFFEQEFPIIDNFKELVEIFLGISLNETNIFHVILVLNYQL